MAFATRLRTGSRNGSDRRQRCWGWDNPIRIGTLGNDKNGTRSRFHRKIALVFNNPRVSHTLIASVGYNTNGRALERTYTVVPPNGVRFIRVSDPTWQALHSPPPRPRKTKLPAVAGYNGLLILCQGVNDGFWN